MGNNNKTAPPEQRVNVGDLIVQVNSVSGDTNAMGQEAMTATVLELTVRRPVEFTITIDKKEPPGMLGVDFEYQRALHIKDICMVGRSLLIKDIKPGLLSRWNENNPGLEVKKWDRIVGVNGYRGESEKILDVMKEMSKFDLSIARTQL